MGKVYTKLEDMLADPAVDWVYVASPNSLHYAQTEAALESGKHVICEKPFAPTRAQAEELAALAERKGLFLLEGITTLFQPHFARIREKSGRNRAGAAGVVHLLPVFEQVRRAQGRADAQRLQSSPSRAARSWISTCTTCILCTACSACRSSVAYHARRHENGIDLGGVAVLENPGFVAQCTGAKDCKSESGAHIIGEKGFIRVENPVSMCTRVTVVTDAGQQVFDEQQGETAWYWEMQGIAGLVAADDRADCRRRMAKTVEWRSCSSARGGMRANNKKVSCFPDVD